MCFCWLFYKIIKNHEVCLRLTWLTKIIQVNLILVRKFKILYFISEKHKWFKKPQILLLLDEISYRYVKITGLVLRQSARISYRLTAGLPVAHQNNTSHKLTWMVKQNGVCSYLKQKKQKVRHLKWSRTPPILLPKSCNWRK